MAPSRTLEYLLEYADNNPKWVGSCGDGLPRSEPGVLRRDDNDQQYDGVNRGARRSGLSASFVVRRAEAD